MYVNNTHCIKFCTIPNILGGMDPPDVRLDLLSMYSMNVVLFQ